MELTVEAAGRVAKEPTATEQVRADGTTVVEATTKEPSRLAVVGSIKADVPTDKESLAVDEGVAEAATALQEVAIRLADPAKTEAGVATVPPRTIPVRRDVAAGYRGGLPTTGLTAPDVAAAAVSRLGEVALGAVLKEAAVVFDLAAAVVLPLGLSAQRQPGLAPQNGVPAQPVVAVEVVQGVVPPATVDLTLREVLYLSTPVPAAIQPAVAGPTVLVVLELEHAAHQDAMFLVGAVPAVAIAFARPVRLATQTAIPAEPAIPAACPGTGRRARGHVLVGPPAHRPARALDALANKVPGPEAVPARELPEGQEDAKTLPRLLLGPGTNARRWEAATKLPRPKAGPGED